MSVLSDADIRSAVATGQLVIDPFIPDQLSAASYDFRLAGFFLEIGIRHNPEDALAGELLVGSVLLTTAMDTLPTMAFYADIYMLPAHGRVLGLSQEWFALDNRIAGHIRSKSSLARLGLRVVSDGGWFDPGFSGYAVLELANDNDFAIELRAGMRIGQMIFDRLEHPCDKPYEGHYTNQRDFAVEKWLESLRKIGELR